MYLCGGECVCGAGFSFLYGCVSVCGLFAGQRLFSWGYWHLAFCFRTFLRLREGGLFFWFG